MLTSELLKAEDADNAPSDIVYTVLNQGSKSGEDRGKVERVNKPGVKVASFTQQDIDNNMIAYVHRGNDTSNNARLALQVN